MPLPTDAVSFSRREPSGTICENPKPTSTNFSVNIKPDIQVDLKTLKYGNMLCMDKRNGHCLLVCVTLRVLISRNMETPNSSQMFITINQTTLYYIHPHPPRMVPIIVTSVRWILHNENSL
jgi:hypothetical protein